jgi:hypothetical protein
MNPFTKAWRWFWSKVTGADDGASPPPTSSATAYDDAALRESTNKRLLDQADEMTRQSLRDAVRHADGGPPPPEFTPPVPPAAQAPAGQGAPEWGPDDPNFTPSEEGSDVVGALSGEPSPGAGDGVEFTAPSAATPADLPVTINDTGAADSDTRVPADAPAAGAAAAGGTDERLLPGPDEAVREFGHYDTRPSTSAAPRAEGQYLDYRIGGAVVSGVGSGAAPDDGPHEQVDLKYGRIEPSYAPKDTPAAGPGTADPDADTHSDSRRWLVPAGAAVLVAAAVTIGILATGGGPTRTTTVHQSNGQNETLAPGASPSEQQPHTTPGSGASGTAGATPGATPSGSATAGATPSGSATAGATPSGSATAGATPSGNPTTGGAPFTSSSPSGAVVSSAPAITAEPKSRTCAVGQMATFSVTASGSPTPTYTWQLSPNHGTSWNLIAGGTAPSYGIQCESNMNGWQFRVVVANSLGTAMSTPATLGVG